MEAQDANRKDDTPVILIAEDDDRVRHLTRAVLERDGYRVLEAKSGEEALRLVAESPDPIHLLLADMVMPKMSGHELAQELQQRWPRMKVLYMSGYTRYGLIDHGVGEEVGAFLWKPFSPQELSKKVQELLD